MQVNRVRSKRSVISWCLYDWANSPFATVIITFVYSVFFSKVVIGDETQGAALWSYAIAFSGFVIAITAPVFGAAADYSGRRKRGVLICSVACITASSLLYFGHPSSDFWNVFLILALVVIANIGFELGQVFYNAMLPHIASKDTMGRISGWSWGLGYAGGLTCLALTLFGLVGFGEIEPFLPVSTAESNNIRASGPLVALWFLIFLLPMMIWTQDAPGDKRPFVDSLKQGVEQLRDMIDNIRSHKNLMVFLAASALYRDGLVTLFSIGGLYAAGQMGMDFQELLIFAIGLNVTAGIGAALFSFVDDKVGSKRTILIALSGLIACGIMILLINDKMTFMILALILGLFIGPAQAAGRTLAARLAPEGMVAQTYGLYAFTGKSIAFLGPLAYGLMTSLFDSQKMGMLSIVLFWLAGFILIAFVKEQRS